MSMWMATLYNYAAGDTFTCFDTSRQKVVERICQEYQDYYDMTLEDVNIEDLAHYTGKKPENITFEDYLREEKEMEVVEVITGTIINGEKIE